ncbi:MAG: hypothetical protein WDW38_003371 [Sanguina aurantia]
MLSSASAAAASQTQSDSLCSTCLTTVRILDDILCDIDATNFMVSLVEKDVCALIGDSPKCRNLAEGLLPVLIQWFRAGSTPARLCSAVGVCSAASLADPTLSQPMLAVADDTQCSMCKFVGNTIKDTAVSAEADAIDIAHQGCDKLPMELADGCDKYIDKYEVIISTFIDSLDVEQLCAMTGSCPETWAALRPASLPASFILAMQPALARYQAALAGGASNDACDVCQMAVIEAHSLIANPTVQQDLLNYTEAICAGLPTYAAECKVYVDQYAPVLFALLEQYLVPQQLCASLGICHATVQKQQGARKALLPGRTLTLRAGGQ